MDIFSIVGWVGTALIVGAYLLNSLKKIDSESAGYQLMNLLGAVGVGFNVFHQAAWPAFTLQCTWGIIAIFTLLKRKPHSTEADK